MTSFKPTSAFFAAFIIMIFALSPMVQADEAVDVGNGVYVAKKSFSAPSNEQPFYGFVKLTPAQITAHEKFLEGIRKSGFPDERAFRRAMQLGWRAVNAEQYGQAAQRFNQAHLIVPGHSALFHGFATLVQKRFADEDYAEKLFETGAKLENRPSGYMADYGRFLMGRSKPKLAQPVLEEAIIDTPIDEAAWFNLATARLQNGELEAACEAGKKSLTVNHMSAPDAADVKRLQQQAKCNW